MSNLIEQRSAIKFCLRNEISAAETLRMLRKAFGDSTMSQKNVYKWYKDFKEGRERVDDLERSGRPTTSTDDQHVNEVKELVLKKRRLTVRELTNKIGISEGSVKTILKGKSKIFFIIHIIYKRKYKNKFFETGLTKCPIHHPA